MLRLELMTLFTQNREHHLGLVTDRDVKLLQDLYDGQLERHQGESHPDADPRPRAERHVHIRVHALPVCLGEPGMIINEQSN